MSTYDEIARMKELLGTTRVDRSRIFDIPFEPFTERSFVVDSVRGWAASFTFSPNLERGRALVFDTAAGRHVVFGTLLAKGVPYRIVGRMRSEWDELDDLRLGTIQRGYVLDQRTVREARVLDAVSGRTYDVFFDPALAIPVSTA